MLRRWVPPHHVTPAARSTTATIAAIQDRLPGLCAPAASASVNLIGGGARALQIRMRYLAAVSWD